MKQSEKVSYVNGVEHRKCLKCNDSHPANEEHFYWNSVRGVWSAYCKPCQRAYLKEHRRIKELKKANKYKHIDSTGVPILPF